MLRVDRNVKFQELFNNSDSISPFLEKVEEEFSISLGVCVLGTHFALLEGLDTVPALIELVYKEIR